MNAKPLATDIPETLARLEKKIDKINRTVNPPFWVKLLRWIARNFFTIVLIIIIIILGYKAWDMYQDLLLRIDEIKNMPANAVDTGKDAIQNVVEKIKFW